MQGLTLKKLTTLRNLDTRVNDWHDWGFPWFPRCLVCKEMRSPGSNSSIGRSSHFPQRYTKTSVRAEGLGGSLQRDRISRFFLLTCVRYYAPEVFSHVFLVLDTWDRWIVICKKIWRVPYMIMIYQQLPYCLGDTKYQKISTVVQLNLLRSW